MPRDTVFGKLADPRDQLAPPEKDLWEGEQFEVGVLGMQAVFSSRLLARLLSSLSSLFIHLMHLTHSRQGCKKVGGRAFLCP